MDQRAKLIDAIVTEINRVFGEGGFDGTESQYAWLLNTYGVTEEEDVQWQTICEFERADLDEDLYEEDELEQLYQWLENDQVIVAFLEALLTKYRSSGIFYTSAVT